MKKIQLICGYIAYEVSVAEAFLLGGIGICDGCNEYVLQGYLVPVLNRLLCKKCFEKWESEAVYYPDDIWFEKRKIEYFESVIGLDGGEYVERIQLPDHPQRK